MCLNVSYCPCMLWLRVSVLECGGFQTRVMHPQVHKSEFLIQHTWAGAREFCTTNKFLSEAYAAGPGRGPLFEKRGLKLWSVLCRLSLNPPPAWWEVGEGRGRDVSFLFCTSPKKQSDPSDHDSDRSSHSSCLWPKGVARLTQGRADTTSCLQRIIKIKTDQSWRECLRIKISKWFHKRHYRNSLSSFNCTVGNRLNFDFGSDPRKKNS